MRQRVSIRDLINSGRTVVGTWNQMSSPEAVDIMADAGGFAFSIIDCEHGAFGIETAENLIRACNANDMVPLVRAPGIDPGWIWRALDIGASAVVIPGVTHAEEVRRAVAGAIYAPEGTRGMCPFVRAGGHGAYDFADFSRQQREHTGVFVMIETREAVENIEEICAVPGLMGVFFGPGDLSVGMGLGFDAIHPDVEAALIKVVEAAKRNSVAVVCPLLSPDPGAIESRARYLESLGVRLLTVGTDKVLFTAGVRAAAAQVKFLNKAPDKKVA